MTTLGRILEIDLTGRNWTYSEPDRDFAKVCLWGRGFNVSYLYDHLPAGIDPLGPKNILAMSCGLLTGTPAPTSSRLHVNALSPQTGLIGSSNIGGYAGARLRSCGLQSIIIRGRADAPVYIYLDEDTVAIRDAGKLKGLDTRETQKVLSERHGGGQLKIMAIGPGGENLVPFACIVSEQDHAAGRTGMGAVMGSKNLKAIVIAKGPKKQAAASPEAARKAVRDYVTALKASPDFETFSEFGGAGYVKWADDNELIGVRNYRETRFEGIDGIDGRKLRPNIVKSGGCYKCPVQCKAELEFTSENSRRKHASRPEFEPMINLGARCGLSDMEAVVHLDNLCTELGLDSTSVGAVLAFAMDCRDRGLIDEKDTGGLDLSWGRADSMETLLRQMAVREGFGGILAYGLPKAAKVLGRGTEKLAAQVKGLDLAAYHPKALMGTALGYAVSSRGGDYNNVYSGMEYTWSPEKSQAAFGTVEAVIPGSTTGKGLLMKRAALATIIFDSLGLCKVPALSMVGAYDMRHETALTNALTGLDLTPEDLFRAGERTANLERLFNIRFGASVCEDRLPKMFSDNPEHPIPDENIRTMVMDYYQAMGWDDTGRPTEETIASLGLSGNPIPPDFKNF